MLKPVANPSQTRHKPVRVARGVFFSTRVPAVRPGMNYFIALTHTSRLYCGARATPLLLLAEPKPVTNPSQTRHKPVTNPSRSRQGSTGRLLFDGAFFSTRVPVVRPGMNDLR